MSLFLVTMSPQFANMPTFFQYIQDSKDIKRFWNHIPYVFCVETDLHISVLTAKFLPFLGTNYLIAEINPGAINGQLPQSAWEWFFSTPPANPFARLEHFIPPPPPPPKPSGF